MVNRAGTESPRSSGTIRLVKEREGAIRSASSNFETMIRAIDTRLAEPESLGQESFLLSDLPHRQHGSMKSTYRFALADFIGGPSLAIVACRFDHFKPQARRMTEPEERLAEPLLRLLLLDPIPPEIIPPERKRPLRHAVSGGLDLSRPAAPREPVVRKRGHHRAGLGLRVR